MKSWSLAAPDARVRNSMMLLSGAVVVAAALCQAIANPIVTPDEAAFASAPTLGAVAPIQAPPPTVNPVTPTQQAVAAAAAVADFAFRAPTPGYGVNSPFGLRRLPWEPRGRMHEGVDIAAPRGLAVGATLPGVVIRAGTSPTYGRFVELRHAEGLTSLYGHLGSVRRGLKPGMSVGGGEAIGVVGNTGRSTGEHLHFEIRSEGKPLNPALFMGRTFASADDLPLSAAARFSRRVRLAVVSPAALARMMPKVAEAKSAKAGGKAVKPTTDGRVRGVLAMGDPSPAAMKAASATAATAVPAHSAATPAPAVSAPMTTAAAAPLTDFSSARLDQAG